MYTQFMQLKPQDIIVLIKLLEYGGSRPSYAQIAKELFISASEVHAAVQRSARARLFNMNESGGEPNRLALEEFLVHGLKYAFPAERGELTRGVPTAHAAEPLRRKIAADGDPPPVWPSVDGKTRGYSFAPLYKTAPKAALRDPYLYEVLALIDAIRDGRARERHIAEKELKLRLHSPRHAEPKH
jgi:hypothetical protein